MNKEHEAFAKKQAVAVATKEDLERAEKEKIQVIPCEMVFTRKPVSETQKELGVATPWKEKARVCVCGNFHQMQMLISCVCFFFNFPFFSRLWHRQP